MSRRDDRRPADVVAETRRLSRAQFIKSAAASGLGVALTGSVALGAIGCGGDDEPAGTTAKAGGSGTPGKPIEVKTVPKAPYEARRAGVKPDLPKRLAVSLPASGEIFVDFAAAAKSAAEARGLDYVEAQAEGDTSKQIQQVQSFLSRGIGGLIVFDTAPPALASLQMQAITRGVPVFTGPFTTSTTAANYDQYDIGKKAAGAAVRWAQETRGGKAQMVIFNLDAQGPTLKPRAVGMHDAIEAGGAGIELVKDVGAKELSAEAGFKLANTVLQTNPDVNAWIGTDSLLLGVLAALKAKGKATEAVGLFGTDGDAQALSEIAKGGVYRATQGALLSTLAYAYGNFAADWLEGKSIPQLMMFETAEIDSAAKVAAFKQANADPAAAFARNQKTKQDFVPYGNTSYEDNRWLSAV